MEKIKDAVSFGKKLEALADEFEKTDADTKGMGDWIDKVNGWANFNVESFLRAMGAYVVDWQERFELGGELPEGMEPFPHDLDWDVFYKIILAGKSYE